MRASRNSVRVHVTTTVKKIPPMTGYSALTHTRHRTRRVSGVPGSAKRRFLNRGRDVVIQAHKRRRTGHVADHDDLEGAAALDDTLGASVRQQPWHLAHARRRRAAGTVARRAPRHVVLVASGSSGSSRIQLQAAHGVRKRFEKPGDVVLPRLPQRRGARRVTADVVVAAAVIAAAAAASVVVNAASVVRRAATRRA